MPAFQHHGPGGIYSVLVKCLGGTHPAKVGCIQTLVYQNLVGLEALLEAKWVEMRYVHGDTDKYPMVPVEIKLTRV